MRRLACAFVLVIAGSGCGGDGAPAVPSGSRGVGRVTAPRPPVVVRPMPRGAAVREVRVIRDADVPLQTLYLGPGSTPARGPALAVGHFPQDTGTVLCGRGHLLDSPGRAFPDRAALDRHGDVVSIEGEVREEEPGYVVGRGLSEAAVRRAARGLRIEGRRRSSVDTDAMPPGFHREAVAPVLPNSTFNPGRREELALRGGAGAVVMTSRLDASGRALWDFFRTTLHDQRCPFSLPASRMVGGNAAAVAVTQRGGRSDAAAAAIARALRVGTRAELRADVTEARHPSPATVVAQCRGPYPSVLSGRTGGVAWAIAFDARAGGSVCTAARRGSVDLGTVISSGGIGQIVSTSVPPGVIELLDRGTLNDVAILAGRVPPTVHRVSVAAGGGSAGDAVMRDLPDDPAHRYWVFVGPAIALVGGITVTADAPDGSVTATLTAP